MKIRFLKYGLVLVIPILTGFSFMAHGWFTFSTVIFSYLMIPALEFLFESDVTNLKSEVSDSLSKDRLYDYLLYLMVPVLYGLLVFYFITISNAHRLSGDDAVGVDTAPLV